MAEQNSEISVIATESKEGVFAKLKRTKYVVSVLIVVLVIVLVVLGALYYRQQSGADNLENVAAVVNGESISIKDFNSAYEPQLEFYKVAYPEVIGEEAPKEIVDSLPRNVLDNLIMEVLLIQYLADKDIEITDEQVREHVKKTIVDEIYGGDWAKYEVYLKENKSSLEIVLRNARRDVLIQTVSKEEKLKVDDFSDWYLKLREKADVAIYLDSYGESGD